MGANTPQQKSSKVQPYYPANRPSFRSKLITRSKEQDSDGLAWELRGDKYYPLLNNEGAVIDGAQFQLPSF